MLISPGDKSPTSSDPGKDMGPPKAKGDQEGDAKGKQHGKGEDQSPPQDSFQNPLPGDDALWKECPLDIEGNLFLQSLAVTVKIRLSRRGLLGL